MRQTVGLCTDSRTQVGQKVPGPRETPVAATQPSIPPAVGISGCHTGMNTIHVTLTVVALIAQAAAVVLLITDSRRAKNARTAYVALSRNGLGPSWDQIDHAPEYILKSIGFHTQRTWAMTCAAVALLVGAYLAFP